MNVLHPIFIFIQILNMFSTGFRTENVEVEALPVSFLTLSIQ